MEQSSKQKIYVSFESITNSQEVIIDLLNKKYNINPPKTIKDLKDLTYKSIYRQIDGKDVEKIMKSKEYYDNLKINQSFKDFYEQTKSLYEWAIIIENKYREIEYLSPMLIWILNNIGDIIIASLYKPINQTILDGIHIDLNYNNFNFNSNGYFKLLLTNFTNTNYNYIKGGEDNLYQVNTWEEIIQILNFFDI